MKNKVVEFIRKHIIPVYFITTFSISGMLFLPYVFFNLDKSGFVLPQLAPGLAAILIVIFVGEKNEIFKIAIKLKTWKVRLSWYLIAIVIPIGILTMRMIFYGIFSNTALFFINLSKVNLILSILPGVLIGAIGEEIGWRGFLLPTLQLRMNAFKSSLILGVLWAFFHFPIVIGNGINIFIIFVAHVTLLSVVITWLYNNSNGSIIITILFHVVINIFTMTIFYLDIGIRSYLAQMIGTLIITCIILMVYDTKTLTRNRNILNATIR